MAQLFSPLQIRDITLKNRIAVSPMCQYSSEDGFANDWHFVHLGSRAVGQASLVITEATAISPEGRISPQDLGLWKDEHIDRLKRITGFILQQEAVPGIQLAHAGRKASHSSPWKGNKQLPASDGGWKTIAPSALPFTPEEEAPAALTKEQIQQVIANFQRAAERALEAGFRVAEVHAAHGYLIHQFMSPLSNTRTDEYGGSFENRTRFLLEVVTAVRKIWPQQYPLLVRISASDWHEQGWSVEDSVRVAPLLHDAGVDMIDCSSGGIISGVKIEAGPGYQVPFAEEIRRRTGMRTGAVGMITSPQQAEEIIAGGAADMVLIAREMLRDPYFPLRASLELEHNIHWPVQYERAHRKK